MEKVIWRPAETVKIKKMHTQKLSLMTLFSEKENKGITTMFFFFFRNRSRSCHSTHTIFFRKKQKLVYFFCASKSSKNLLRFWRFFKNTELKNLISIVYRELLEILSSFQKHFFHSLNYVFQKITVSQSQITDQKKTEEVLFIKSRIFQHTILF